MRFSLFSCIFLSLLGISGGIAFSQPLNYNPDKIDALVWLQAQKFPQTTIAIQVLLADRVDARQLAADWDEQRLALNRRAQQIIALLQQKAATTQGPVLEAMRADAGIEPSSVTSLWITNMIEAAASIDAIKRLSLLPEVALISWNEPAFTATPSKAASPATAAAQNGHEPGHDVINAPAMWRLGYSGYGKKALILDTGVDGGHPSLFRSFWGNFVPVQQAWFDLGGRPFPEDCDGHGTHVAGTVLGLTATNNDTIGVAPGGLWMGATGIRDFEGKCPSFSVAQALQWALDPDGNPNTTQDIPDVINNSWGSRNPTAGSCGDSRRFIFDALEAAGVAVVFAAGNEGPDTLTINSPSILNTDLVNIFSVGAVAGQAAGYPIATFSSRGPSLCPGATPALRIKPEVSAPGVNIRSAYPGGGMASLSGTSMASPHVAGALLLLREAFPTVSGTQLKLALYFSAVDYGAPGEDNHYGRGIIDVFAAYQYLIQQGFQPAPVMRENDAVASDLANLGARVCTHFVFPFFILKNGGNQPLTQATIQYAYSNGATGTINWTGNLLKGNIIPVPIASQTLPNGNYTLTVNVIQTNGTTDDRPLDNQIVRTFAVATGPAPTGVSDTVCVNNPAILRAVLPGPDAEVQWYELPVGGFPVGSGTAFITPKLTTSRTYYAEGTERIRAGLSGSGAGAGFHPQPKGMNFDVLESLTLHSVAIQSRGIGLRAIQLLNPQGTIVFSRSYFFASDTALRVEIGVQLAPGAGYRLQISGTADLAFTPGVSYPIQGGKAISLTGPGDGSSNYYFFYDWDISYNPSCQRIPVTAHTQAGLVAPVMVVSDSVISLTGSAYVQFIDQTPNSVSRLWDFGDGSTSTLVAPIHTYTQPGEYLVTLRPNTGTPCSGLAVKKIVVNTATSIRPVFEPGSLILSPNPGRGDYRLQVSLQEAEPLELRVSDLTGRIIWQQTSPRVQQADIPIRLPSLPGGVYLLQVASPSRSQYLRLVQHD